MVDTYRALNIGGQGENSIDVSWQKEDWEGSGATRMVRAVQVEHISLTLVLKAIGFDRLKVKCFQRFAFKVLLSKFCFQSTCIPKARCTLRWYRGGTRGT